MYKLNIHSYFPKSMFPSFIFDRCMYISDEKNALGRERTQSAFIDTWVAGNLKIALVLKLVSKTHMDGEFEMYELC